MKSRAEIKKILTEVKNNAMDEAKGLKQNPKTIITKDGFIKDGVVYHTIGKSEEDIKPKKNR